MRYIIMFLVLICSLGAVAQNPSNYQYRTVRERLLAFMVDSTFHLPRYNGTPSGIRTGASTHAGALAIDTANMILYMWGDYVWTRLARYDELATGSRFGVEDTRATQNREFSGAGSYSMTIDSLSSLLFGFDPSNGFSVYDYTTSTNIFRHNSTVGSQMFSQDGLNYVQSYNSAIILNLTANTDSLLFTNIPYSSSDRLVALQLDTLTNRVYRKTASGSGGVDAADLPLRITSTTVSADTSTSYSPSLTTNARLQKIVDSLVAIGLVMSPSNAYWYSVVDECQQNNQTNGFSKDVSGTGSSLSYNVTTTTNAYEGTIGGNTKYETGTTNSGFGRWSVSNGGSSPLTRLGSTRLNFGVKVLFQALSDGTDEYEFIHGFMSTNTPPISNASSGIYFRYDKDDSTGNFIAVCKLFGGGVTEVDTGVPLASDTYFELEISYFSGSAYFYIDDVLVATISTNLPNATNLTISGYINKLVGTTSRYMITDWIAEGTRAN